MSTMKYVQLNGTDLNVSRVCLGTWQFNAGAEDLTWSSQDEKTSQQIVQKAIERGINFFDTAEAYKNSEHVLGKALEGSGNRANVIVASKFGQNHPKGQQGYSALDIENALTNTLSSLRTSYLDLYQAHWPICVETMEGAVQQLELEKARGRIRYYGYSNFGVNNMNDFENAGGKPVSNQLPYNLLWRSIEYSVLPKARQLGLSILAYSPLQQGLLSGKFYSADQVPEGRRRTRLFNSHGANLARHGETGAEKETFQAIDKIRTICEKKDISMTCGALSWLLAQDNVASVIVGCSNVDQVVANTDILTLDKETERKLTNATDELKAAMGVNPDLWAADSRFS